MGTILLDLVMMIFSITNITIMGVLSLAAGCQPSPREDCELPHSYSASSCSFAHGYLAFGAHDLRQLVADYSSSFFGDHKKSEIDDKIDFLCTVPKVVYVLSVISM